MKVLGLIITQRYREQESLIHTQSNITILSWMSKKKKLGAEDLEHEDPSQFDGRRNKEKRTGR